MDEETEELGLDVEFIHTSSSLRWTCWLSWGRKIDTSLSTWLCCSTTPPHSCPPQCTYTWSVWGKTPWSGCVFTLCSASHSEYQSYFDLLYNNKDIHAYLLSRVKLASVKPTFWASMGPRFCQAVRWGATHQGAQWGTLPKPGFRYHFQFLAPWIFSTALTNSWWRFSSAIQATDRKLLRGNKQMINVVRVLLPLTTLFYCVYIRNRPKKLSQLDTLLSRYQHHWKWKNP